MGRTLEDGWKWLKRGEVFVIQLFCRADIWPRLLGDVYPVVTHID